MDSCVYVAGIVDAKRPEARCAFGRMSMSAGCSDAISRIFMLQLFDGHLYALLELLLLFLAERGHLYFFYTDKFPYFFLYFVFVCHLPCFLL